MKDVSIIVNTHFYGSTRESVRTVDINAVINIASISSGLYLISKSSYLLISPCKLKGQRILL